MKYLLGLRSQYLFLHAELAEFVRQYDELFTDFFNNKVRAGNIDDNVEKLLKTRIIRLSDENYLKDASYMYAENEPARKRNKSVLNYLPGELSSIEAVDKIPVKFKYPLDLT